MHAAVLLLLLLRADPMGFCACGPAAFTEPMN
jgi:hypothetical protein